MVSVDVKHYVYFTYILCYQLLAKGCADLSSSSLSLSLSFCAYVSVCVCGVGWGWGWGWGGGGGAFVGVLGRVFKPCHFNIQHARLLFTKNSTVEKPTKWSDVTIRKVLSRFRYHAVVHVRCTIRREATQILMLKEEVLLLFSNISYTRLRTVLRGRRVNVCVQIEKADQRTIT